MKFLLNLFKRKQFTLGPQVFQSRSWLEHKVNEQLILRRLEQELRRD